jgi:hypothetical protein
VPADFYEVEFDLFDVAFDLSEIRCNFPVLGGCHLVRERTEPLDESFVLHEHGCFRPLQPRQAELEIEFIEDSER